MAYTVASIRTYGVASKWSSEAVRSRGTSTAASADELFFGPKQTGTDWGAAIMTATSSDDAMVDYVKRNYEKFSGSTLEGMLVSTDLVDWYKGEMQKKIEEGQKQLAESQDSLGEIGDDPFNTSRTRSILSALAASTKSTADDGDIITAPLPTDAAATASATDGTATADGPSSGDGSATATGGSAATDAPSASNDAASTSSGSTIDVSY